MSQGPFSKSRRQHPILGFTLTELLVVIILVGLLAALAIPKFGKTTDQAMELEARLALEKVYQLQNIHYLKNKKYSADLDQLGFEQEELIDDQGNGRARYLIVIERADENSYTARALPQVKDLAAFSMDHTGKIQEEAR
ncbi:Prepilin-type N-terminal cleavage/methylation domain-containing protein [Sulfidibacter corallicola]|uniref:Prepilin-type N-terminal cleavage/methylation domain-containing protein n=1 Tax=Sulfidibacter corallicola TaxID=2818388 RepID=A0A8A4TL27_SULCO|nr:prepilin-type N-terminal cleavage/methylation domain-containing protein [Sulfidibacter corallicola]QTD50177.1 prepilin-type N-terminal cleavage/methylation domain-containing protein [Sulfidibacter corallicola]